jgi:hypothetical protein
MVELPSIVQKVTLADRAVQVDSYVFAALWLGASIISLLRGYGDVFAASASLGVAAGVFYFLMRYSVRSRHKDQAILNQTFAVAAALDAGYLGHEALQKACETLTAQRQILGEVDRGVSRDQIIEAFFIVFCTLQWGFGEQLINEMNCGAWTC